LKTSRLQGKQIVKHYAMYVANKWSKFFSWKKRAASFRIKKMCATSI